MKFKNKIRKGISTKIGDTRFVILMFNSKIKWHDPYGKKQSIPTRILFHKSNGDTVSSYSTWMCYSKKDIDLIESLTSVIADQDDWQFIDQNLKYSVLNDHFTIP